MMEEVRVAPYADGWVSGEMKDTVPHIHWQCALQTLDAAATLILIGDMT